MANKKSLTSLVSIAVLSMGLAGQPHASEQGAAAESTKAEKEKTNSMHYLDEMALMDAQIAYLRKESELRSALEQRSRHESLPKVVSIVGSGKTHTAQVVFESGIMRWLKPGDALAGGLKVRAISRTAVTVGNDREAFLLPFVSAVNNPAAGQGNQAMLPLAPPPNLNIAQPMPMPMPAPGLSPVPME